MKKQCKITLTKTCLGNCNKMFFTLSIMLIGLIFCGCNGKEDTKNNIDVEVAKTADTATTKVIESKISKSENSSKNDSQPLLTKESNETVLLEKKPNKKTDSAAVSSKALPPKTKEINSLNKVSETPKNAEFPGGIDQFHTFFMKEYKKPEGIYYWKLNFTLAFAVEKNGSVSFLECSPAVEEPLQKEIVRVLNLCPKWQPGEANGKKTRMQYSVPILLK